VDNFVKNWHAMARRPAPMRPCDNSMTYWAAENQMKSTYFNEKPCSVRGFAGILALSLPCGVVLGPDTAQRRIAIDA
jgi:hypothetical protein